MTISQREARRLRARVMTLETEINQSRNAWTQDYPGGVNLGYLDRDTDWLWGKLKAARQLKHAVVVTVADEGRIQFFALPIGKP